MKLFINFFLVLLYSCLIHCQYKSVNEIIRAKDPNLNIGICLTSPLRPNPDYTKHAQRLFTPASNTKLFTAAAAFHYLGPDFVFKTLLSTDLLVENGIVKGSLYINFCGDPSLTRQDIHKLFAQLKDNNISRIDGDVCIIVPQQEDLSVYFGPGFCIDDIGASWNAPVSTVIIDGNICINADNKERVVSNPCENAINLISKILDQLDIVLKGTVCRCPVSNFHANIIAFHESQPLKDLIAHMLKTSDNLYANAFFKVLGHVATGSDGSWKTGTQAVKKFASECLGIDFQEWVIRDGAGLSRYNLISPEQIVKLLIWVYRQKNLYPIFSDCLAISGVDGTLQHRLLDHAGVVKAKTGTMGGVSALSGYLCKVGSEPYIFSIMLNGFTQQKDKDGNVGVNYKHDIEDVLCHTFIKTMMQNISPIMHKGVNLDA